MLTFTSGAALVLGCYSSFVWREYASCQSKQQGLLIEVMDARAGAVDRLMADVAVAKKGEDVKAALDLYAKTRASNPLPPPPDQVCKP